MKSKIHKMLKISTICLASALILGACGSSETENYAKYTAVNSAPAEDGHTSEVEFQEGRLKSDNWPDISAQVTYVNYGVGNNEEFDRVVVEYSGDSSVPLSFFSDGWTNKVYDSGRGEPFELDSVHAIQIKVGGVNYDFENPSETQKVTIPEGVNLKNVIIEAPFEGHQTINIGKDTVSKVRVFTLENPTRLVIDIAK